VTGDGRMVQSGGRVMKNVAGYDLTSFRPAGFGAFGVIVLVHLRLRTLPRADITYVLEGAREDLTQVGEDIAGAGLTPAALELVSPALARRERWSWRCVLPARPRWWRRTKRDSAPRVAAAGSRRCAPRRRMHSGCAWPRILGTARDVPHRRRTDRER